MRQRIPRALQIAFERSFEDVYRYVAYRLAPDLEATEEITQDVFLAALEGWAGYKGNGSPLGWLRGIARRKIADHFRSRSRSDLRRNGALAEIAPAHDEAWEERVLLVASVMGTLPSRYADLLEKRYFDGLSVREISHRRNTTEKAVESALSRARVAFRQTFEELRDKEEAKDDC